MQPGTWLLLPVFSSKIWQPSLATLGGVYTEEFFGQVQHECPGAGGVLTV
jgi:hypothetical protein